MKIEINEQNGYTIERDDGTVIQLTANEVSLIVNKNLLHTLRCAIESVVDKMTGDTLNPEAFEDDEFGTGAEGIVNYIYDAYSDDVETTGILPDDDDIEERIFDEIGAYYEGVLIEEEEEE